MATTQIRLENTIRFQLLTALFAHQDSSALLVLKLGVQLERIATLI
jgi:hypothetical protein